MDHVIQSSALERMLRRDRVITLIALISASLLAWIYIAVGIGMDIEAMSMPEMVMPADWTPSYFALMFAMWGTMMVAMMLPSAAPMVLLFATIERQRRETSPFLGTTRFALAYVAVWIGFSFIATLLQWQLDRLAQLTPVIATTNATLAAAVLIAAGVYQFTPLKQACLQGCRSPLEFISQYWARGPFGIGLLHGLYCLGCCWMLMLLLFVGGAMNLIWVALIAVFVLTEKTAPQGKWIGYGGGVGAIAAGTWMLFARVVA